MRKSFSFSTIRQLKRREDSQYFYFHNLFCYNQFIPERQGRPTSVRISSWSPGCSRCPRRTWGCRWWCCPRWASGWSRSRWTSSQSAQRPRSLQRCCRPGHRNEESKWLKWSYRSYSEVAGVPSLLAPGVDTDVVPAGDWGGEGAGGGGGVGVGHQGGGCRGLVSVQSSDAVIKLLW